MDYGVRDDAMNVKLWAGKMGNTKHMGIMFL
jgi:hypothetical protein